MKQSPAMSLIEAATNVVFGYMQAIATQIVVFPWFGIETGLAEHMTIGLAFVGVSLARGYLLRAVRGNPGAGLLMSGLLPRGTPARLTVFRRPRE